MTEHEPTNTPDPTDDLYSSINPFDVRRLKGKTAIVTGGTGGIGEGIARRLASEGANIVLSGRSTNVGESIAADIRGQGHEATFLTADMSQSKDIQMLVKETVSEYDGINVVVNNAATWTNDTFSDRGIEDWKTVMRVNLRGPWLLARYGMEHMPAGSTIINISSIHEEMTCPDLFPYNVSKAGLGGLTRSLAIDLSPLDIRVNAILPGLIRTHPEPAPPEEHREYRENAPSNRIGMPADIASMTANLASPEASFINGQCITVDGGISIRYPYD
jgi:NAD(P)-dependent dehydrogenase (short-subunit alcohol dehydrogenase family)